MLALTSNGLLLKTRRHNARRLTKISTGIEVDERRKAMLMAGPINLYNPAVPKQVQRLQHVTWLEEP